MINLTELQGTQYGYCTVSVLLTLLSSPLSILVACRPHRPPPLSIPLFSITLALCPLSPSLSISHLPCHLSLLRPLLSSSSSKQRSQLAVARNDDVLVICRLLSCPSSSSSIIGVVVTRVGCKTSVKHDVTIVGTCQMTCLSVSQ